MADSICPFSATLVSEDFGCRNAAGIVRRGGAEIACTSDAAHARCRALFRNLKEAALPAFGVADDPLQMPHSVLVKIQYGGLLGVQRTLNPALEGAMAVADIDRLVTSAAEHFPSLQDIPYAELSNDITGYRLPRRRRRK
jgi:hypothetical protein